ncbi:MAG: hypothetical protein ACRD9R_21445 [Pyrinomonadaceae bacterium]
MRLKRNLSIALVASLLWTLLSVPATAQDTPTVKLSPEAEKIKAGVARIGSGLKARVKVRLQDGTKLQGFVEGIGDQSFAVVRTDNGRLGERTVIAYEEVTQLKAKGVSLDWLRVAAGTAKGLQILHGILKGIGPLRLPPQPRR